jgi:hypothetical protein
MIEQEALIEVYSILPLHKAYGTVKIKIQDKILLPEIFPYTRQLLRFNKRVLRYMHIDTPPKTKIYLKKEICNFIEKEQLQIDVYDFADEARRIEIIKNNECIIRIQQKNVFLPQDSERRDFFND